MSHPVPCASTPPQVRIAYLRDAAALYEPDGLRYATPGSVGLDLRLCLPEDEMDAGEICLHPGERRALPSGVAIQPLTPGIAGFVYSRSGLGAIQGLTVAQGTGVIDPDYRGEITVVLRNTSTEPRRLRRGERIAQLVFQPAFQVTLETVPVLDATARGAGGFGHSGRS